MGEDSSRTLRAIETWISVQASILHATISCIFEAYSYLHTILAKEACKRRVILVYLVILFDKFYVRYRFNNPCVA